MVLNFISGNSNLLKVRLIFFSSDYLHVTLVRNTRKLKPSLSCKVPSTSEYVDINTLIQIDINKRILIGMIRLIEIDVKRSTEINRMLSVDRRRLK